MCNVCSVIGVSYQRGMQVYECVCVREYICMLYCVSSNGHWQTLAVRMWIFCFRIFDITILWIPHGKSHCFSLNQKGELLSDANEPEQGVTASGTGEHLQHLLLH